MFSVKSAELLEDTREIRALRVWQICLPQRQYTHYRSRHFTVTSRMFLSTVPLPITRANSARGVKLFRGFRPAREVTRATEGTQDQAGPRLTLQLAAGPHRAVVGSTTAAPMAPEAAQVALLRTATPGSPWLTAPACLGTAAPHSPWCAAGLAGTLPTAFTRRRPQHSTQDNFRLPQHTGQLPLSSAVALSQKPGARKNPPI